jgi:hypothetical protein
MIQRDVADRLLAEPGTRTYTSLSVLYRLCVTLRRVRDLSPGLFFPVPNVRSSFVRATPRADTPLAAGELAHVETVVRAAFGQRTTPADLWRNQRQVWWSQLLHTLTQRRLSPWRSLTQPVYQLEGVRVLKAGARVRQIRRRKAGAGFMVSLGYSLTEQCLVAAALSLLFWFTPEGETPLTLDLLTGVLPTFLAVGGPIIYGIVVVFLEPFYVAAGFAIYLNRRAELEAWDIEQEFRRAFA